MQVSEINEGQKATWSLTGTDLIVTAGAQSITADLAAAQSDTEQIITVFLDNQMQLQIGTGQWYVASVIVPAARTALADSGQVDEEGNPELIQETLPLDTDGVSLVLWALPDLVVQTEGGTI